jgi:hypothetical protein
MRGAVKTTLLGGILALNLLAQTITEPPLLLQLIRRAGTDATSIPPYADAQAAVNVFGMTSLTGPAETWFLEAHNSFASIEDVTEAHSAMLDNDRGDRYGGLSGDVLTQSRTLIAVYRPGFSYRPDQAARMLPRTRYFSVTLYRTRPGDAEFSELLKTRKDFLDSMNLDRPEIAYQVISGAPAATYLLLAPLTSLRSLDEGLQRRSSRSESPSGSKSGSSVELSRGQLLFRVQPRLSYVSDEFASEAQEFWRRK